MVGTTITSITASELSRIVRFPAPTGPAGSKMLGPPQPESASAAPRRTLERAQSLREGREAFIVGHLTRNRKEALSQKSRERALRQG